MSNESPKKSSRISLLLIAAWLGSQAVFFYIVAVALTRSPLPFGS